MPPEVEEGATETPSSVRDDLLAAVREVEGGEAPETPQDAAPDRTRDESGRFVAKEQAHDAEPSRIPDTGSQEPRRVAAENTGRTDPATPPAEARATDPQLAAAPGAWSNATKAKWNELPQEVRSEILKREADVHRGFTKMDEERTFAKEMQKVVAPYEAIIRASGGTIPGAVSDVLNTAYILRTADPQTKAQTIAQVCRQYGVDLRLVAQPQQNVDPNVANLQQKIQQLEGQWSQRQQQEKQQLENQVLTQVETFGQDPKHPHFRAVSAHMGALMQGGQAETMEQAYEMAVWARPDLRAQLLAAQTAQQSATQQTRQRTDKARAKAVSVRGGPGGFTAPQTGPKATLREELEAAFAEQRGGI